MNFLNLLLSFSVVFLALDCRSEKSSTHPKQSAKEKRQHDVQRSVRRARLSWWCRLLSNRDNWLLFLKLKPGLGNLLLHLAVELLFKSHFPAETLPAGFKLRLATCSQNALVSLEKLNQTVFCSIKFLLYFSKPLFDKPQVSPRFLRLQLSDAGAKVLYEAFVEPRR